MMGTKQWRCLFTKIVQSDIDLFVVFVDDLDVSGDSLQLRWKPKFKYSL